MSTTAVARNKTLDMVYIALFAVLIAVCSWISIPTTVPFTLQTFGVFVTVGVLGGKRGSLAVLIYLLLGAIGVPVFAGFTGSAKKSSSSCTGADDVKTSSEFEEKLSICSSCISIVSACFFKASTIFFPTLSLFGIIFTPS